MTSYPKSGHRMPSHGYKKKIAKLEAENAELKVALADAERRCAVLESNMETRAENLVDYAIV